MSYNPPEDVSAKEEIQGHIRDAIQIVEDRMNDKDTDLSFTYLNNLKSALTHALELS